MLLSKTRIGKIGNYDFMRNLFLLTYFLSDLMKVELSLEPCLHIQDKLSKPPWIFNVILWDFCKPRSHQITSSYVWLYCPSMPPTDQYTSTAYGLFVYIHQKEPVIYTCLIKVLYLLGHLGWHIAIGLFPSSCGVYRPLIILYL